jgi:hypothetical protein
MEIVDEPILSKSEILAIVHSLGGDFFSEQDIEKFVDIIHSGFADPYSYDKTYSDFLIRYFGLDKEFVARSAPIILEDKTFQKMFDGRGSDEEYHTEVLKWNIDNLGLRFSFDDYESLEYAIHSFNHKYKLDLPQPDENFHDYWKTLNFSHAKKSLLYSYANGDILVCDKSTANNVIELLDKIDYTFETIG